MDGNGGLKIDFKPSGRIGNGILCARIGGDAVHTQKLDITDPAAREVFVKSVCEGRKGIDREEIVRTVESLAGQTIGDGGGDEKERISQSQALVALAEGVEFFHHDDAPYATIEVSTAGGSGSHRETHPVQGKTFRQWLSKRFWDAHGKVPGAQARQDAIDTLAGKALFAGAEIPVFVRVAHHDGALYLDLGDKAWRAVVVTAEGWELVEDPPVRFVRKRGMLPLPVPVRGGSLAQLRPLINAGDDANWCLFVAWLVGALHPRGPYAILAVNGEQGSAKSTTCRMLRQLIDPNVADLRAAPRDERDLMIAASNARVVAFDNLSSIPPLLSDSLCRLATGGGFATRELYTDDGEKLFQATRPIMFNGIEELATRPDLLERSLLLNLPTIHEYARLSEAELWQRYEEERPSILGALLDAVSTAMRNIASVKLRKRPRMADFAEWVVAAEPALPWDPGTFLDAYAGNRGSANELAIEAASIGPAIVGLMQENAIWTGMVKDLLAELDSERHSDQRTRNRQDWPKTPKGLSDKLRRLAPALRQAGIEATFGKHTKYGTPVMLEQVGVEPSPASPPSPAPSGATSDAVADPGEVMLGDDPRICDAPGPSPKSIDGGGTSAPRDDGDGGDGPMPTCREGTITSGRVVMEL